jgi:hypothetical protein
MSSSERGREATLFLLLAPALARRGLATRRRVMGVQGSGVYRTESGMIFRVSEDIEGHLSVGVLQDARWVDARVGIVGLRVAPTTVRLTPKQVLDLPR